MKAKSMHKKHRSYIPFLKKQIPLIALLWGSLALTNQAKAETMDQKTQPQIIISTPGYSTAKPDIAIVELGVSETAASGQEATNNVRTIMNKIIAKLKENGVAPQDIQTSTISLYKINDEKNQYRSENLATVRIRDINKLGKIFDDSVALGANLSNRISFSNTNKTNYMRQASKNAIKNAFEEAQNLAQAANVKLGPILEIKENNQNDGSPIVMRSTAMLNVGATMGEAPTPIEAGELVYSSDVTMRFAIIQ